METKPVLELRKLPAMPDDYIHRPDDFYFPINMPQFNELYGKMMTHLEAIGLDKKTEEAHKIILKQTLWKWYDGVQENSITSWKAIIGPIDIKQRQEELGWKQASNEDEE